jgi:cardiolipin synthase (CMP-forming)
MLKHIPNCLTILRLLMALPLGMAILAEDYSLALIIGLIAGLTDALDGILARRLNAFSRFGAALDPVADKTVITACFVCFALVDLIPWYLAAIVICRDIVIVTGASSYFLLYGPFEFSATRLSKGNMFFQICFCLIILFSQVVPGIPEIVITLSMILIVLLALASGIDYVLTWTKRALQAQKNKSQSS